MHLFEYDCLADSLNWITIWKMPREMWALEIKLSDWSLRASTTMMYFLSRLKAQSAAQNALYHLWEGFEVNCLLLRWRYQSLLLWVKLRLWGFDILIIVCLRIAKTSTSPSKEQVLTHHHSIVENLPSKARNHSPLRDVFANQHLQSSHWWVFQVETSS